MSTSLWPLGPQALSPPGSSVHGILQARILEWAAIPFSRGLLDPRSPALQADSLPSESPGKPTFTKHTFVHVIPLFKTLICGVSLYVESTVNSPMTFHISPLLRPRPPAPGPSVILHAPGNTRAPTVSPRAVTQDALFCAWSGMLIPQQAPYPSSPALLSKLLLTPVPPLYSMHFSTVAFITFFYGLWYVCLIRRLLKFLKTGIEFYLFPHSQCLAQCLASMKADVQQSFILIKRWRKRE